MEALLLSWMSLMYLILELLGWDELAICLRWASSSLVGLSRIMGPADLNWSLACIFYDGIVADSVGSCLFAHFFSLTPF